MPQPKSPNSAAKAWGGHIHKHVEKAVGRVNFMPRVFTTIETRKCGTDCLGHGPVTHPQVNVPSGEAGAGDPACVPTPPGGSGCKSTLPQPEGWPAGRAAPEQGVAGLELGWCPGQGQPGRGQGARAGEGVEETGRAGDPSWGGPRGTLSSGGLGGGAAPFVWRPPSGRKPWGVVRPNSLIRGSGKGMGWPYFYYYSNGLNVLIL